MAVLRRGLCLWPSFLRHALLPLGDRLAGQRMMARLRFLEVAQWWDSGRIRDRRDALLRDVVRVSYDEVPLYRDAFDAAGVKPADIATAEDLRKLPILSKDTLRAGYPARIVRPTGQKTYEVSTSGSTGRNLTLREDARTAGWYRATFMLALEWAGWHIGEPHLQTGMTPSRTLDRRLKDFFLRCHYVSAYDLTDRAVRSALDALERRGIDHLWGYPGSLMVFARHAVAMGWNRPLRSVVTWGDMLYPGYRAIIERAFRTRVFDTYGCGEGFHVAAQCGAGMNYHVHDLDVVAEFLDDDGRPVPSGTPGHVVITRLHAGPTPLIRYRVGDIAVPGSGSCPCGRGFALMNGIQGRDTDIVVTPRGNRLIVHFFTGILEHFPEIDAFQVVQERRDAIQFSVVPRGRFDAESERRVLLALQARGIDDLRVEFRIVDEIPLSPAGKRRFVINKLDSGQRA